jgi:acyl-CoA synthetase (AMP-forming)/AMP-acid ligase II
VGLVASNGTEYVKCVLESFERGEVVVPLHGGDDRAELASVEEIRRPTGGDPWMTVRHTPRSDDALALIAFTSGTTGTPKGVLLSHRCLGDACQRLIEVMGIDDSIREYVGVPVYHSFGFGRCRTVAAAGGSFYVPPRGFNPAECAELLSRGAINALSIVPTLARVLLANASLFRAVGERLRWCELGSQPMSASEKQRLRELFPAAVIVQHYGLTEASRATFLPVHEVVGEALDSVGKPAGDTEVRIDEDGKIAIRGSLLASALLIGGEVRPLVGDDGWFHTTDHGRLRDGWLHFLGRADDVINCGGIKIAPEAIEAELMGELGLSVGLAVARVPHPLRGEGVLLALEPGAGIELPVAEAALQRALARRGLTVGDALRVVTVEELPRTAAGKVRRQALTQRFASEVAPSLKPRLDDLSSVRGVLSAALDGREPGPQDTFVRMGGDSLSYVQATVGLERLLGRLPEDWENFTLTDLEALPRVTSQGRIASLETGIVVRALAILSVVNTHIGTGLLTLGLLGSLPGGTNALMLLSGFAFARFHGARVAGTGRARPMVTFLARILPAFWVIDATYLWAHHVPHPERQLLLYSTCFPFDNRSFWFIEALVHANLLLVGALLFPPLRRLYQSRAFAWSVGLTVIGWGSAMLSEHVLGKSPHSLLAVLWLFALGIAAVHARRVGEKWAVGALLAAGSLSLMAGRTTDIAWTAVAGLALLVVPRVPIPRVLEPMFSLFAKASLFIYLAHTLAADVFTKLTGVAAAEPRYVSAVLGGLALYFANELVRNAVTRWWRARDGAVALPEPGG